MDEYLKQAIEGKKGAGQASLIKYRRGMRITQRQAIQAHCYECNGLGESDICTLEQCSLYPYSPYRVKES